MSSFRRAFAKGCESEWDQVDGRARERRAENSRERKFFWGVSFSAPCLRRRRSVGPMVLRMRRRKGASDWPQSWLSANNSMSFDLERRAFLLANLCGASGERDEGGSAKRQVRPLCGRRSAVARRVFSSAFRQFFLVSDCRLGNRPACFFRDDRSFRRRTISGSIVRSRPRKPGPSRGGPRSFGLN